MADEEKPAFSDQQVDAISGIVNRVVNSAIAARDKMSDKKRLEDREALKTDVAKLLEDKLAGFKPGDDGEGGKKGKRSKEDDVELAALRKSVEDLRQQNEQEKQRAAKERAKNIDNSVRTKIYDALGEHGLDQARARAAFAAFKLDDRIEAQVDDETDAVSVLFRDDDGQQVPLADGVKRWVKTDAAKIYLPPTGAKGSGAKPPNGAPPKGPLGEGEVRMNLGEALKNALT